MHSVVVDDSEQVPLTDDEATSLVLAKVGFSLAVFAVAFLAGVLPLKIKGCGAGNPLFMSLANAFSGGLFLAIALFHILPEVTDGYHHYLEEQHHHEEVAP